jgi:hypothetical protein
MLHAVSTLSLFIKKETSVALYDRTHSLLGQRLPSVCDWDVTSLVEGVPGWTFIEKKASFLKPFREKEVRIELYVHYFFNFQLLSEKWCYK